MLTYNLFNDALELRDIVNTFFNEASARERRKDYPYIRIFEGDDEVVIKALVPGVKQDDLNISLVETSLLIEGEKKDDYSNNPYIRKERFFGPFKKAIKLPYRIDGNSINASLREGVLTIILKKSEEAKPKKIEIK